MVNPFKIGAAVLVALIMIGSAFGSFYKIDQGERGVILRNGAIIGTAEPGLAWKYPFIDTVVELDIRSQSRRYTDVLAYSRDQQTAGLVVSVNYRVPEGQVQMVYENYGSIENMLSRLLDRKMYDVVKNIFGQFNAVTSIQERTRLTAEIQIALQEAVIGPIIIESVQLENIDFSDAYEESIEQRMLAEVEVQRVTQNAEREEVQARIAVIQAQAQADALVAKARAEAEAVRLAGEAEAYAIQVKGEALRLNPGLVDLITAENWDGSLPTTMVPNATVPFVNVNRAATIQ